MKQPRHSHTATLLDGAACRGASPPGYCGKVLVVGGSSAANSDFLSVSPLASAELYDPTTGTWSSQPAMNLVSSARYLHTAALLDGPRCRGSLPLPAPWCGKVLVAAGLGDPVTVNGKAVSLRAGLRTAELYDPVSQTWARTTGDLALGRYAHTMTAIDGGPCRAGLPVPPPYCGKVLVAGGAPVNGAIRNGYPEAELYEPDLDRWVPTGAMTGSRIHHNAVLLDGPACRKTVPALYCNKVLVGGGTLINNLYNPPAQLSAELYDPTTGLWSSTGPMTSSRVVAGGWTMTVLDGPACRLAVPAPHCGKVLSVGGADPVVSISGAAADLYDPELGVFMATDRQITRAAGNAVLLDGPVCRGAASALLSHCGRVLVFGGGGGGEGGDVAGGAFAELFDASASSQPPSVVSLEPGAGPSYGGIRVTISGAGFTDASRVFFGEREAPHFTVESPTRIVATSPSHAPGVVDIAIEAPVGRSAVINSTRFTFFGVTHEWTTSGSRVSDLAQPTITALADGRILAAGGQVNALSFGGASELFDPATGRWDPVAPLAPARKAHTATLLSNGEVLVVGGIGMPCCTTLATAQIFNVATGWRATGSLPEPRAWHTATLLPSGKVLVAGGVDVGNVQGSLSVSDSSVRASADLYDPVTGTWTRVGPLDTGRWKHHAVVLEGGRVLVAAGLRGALHPTASAEVYEPELERFRPTGSLAVPRMQSTMTSLADGRVLIAGGCEDKSLCGTLAQPEPEIYEPAAADPVTGVPGTWRSLPQMPSIRSSHTATLIEGSDCDELCGNVLLTGGIGSSKGVATASADLFDPVTMRWQQALPMNTARSEHAAVALPGGRLLAVGGESSRRSTELFRPIKRGAPPAVKAVEPPGGQSGTRVRITGTALSGTTLVSFGGVQVEPLHVTEYVVVAVAPPQSRGTVALTVTTPVGTSTNDPLEPSDDFAYAPGQWRVAGSMASVRYLHTSTRLDGTRCRGASPPDYCGKVLVAGGTTDFRPLNVGARPALAHRSAELYDPAGADGAGTWASTTTDMATPRFNHTATLLDGPECHGPELTAPLHCGKVLVTGGELVAFGVPTAELYDPTTGTWAPTGPLTTRRFSHSATLLRDGRVLVVGGSDLETGRGGLKSAEIYDPRTGAWTPAPAPALGRNTHTATLLEDGRVLVAGGLTNAPDPEPDNLSHAEIYDPRTGWETVEPMAIQRFSHTATLLTGPRCGEHCGHVLVVGGVQRMSPTAFHRAAELYDPVKDEWAPAAIPGAPRAGHTATLLPIGMVLIGGGDLLVPGEERPPPTASAELYDPLTGLWNFSDSLAVPRGLHASSLLDGPKCRLRAPPAYCGTVLFAGGTTSGELGGFQGGPLPVKTAEVYSPAPDVSGIDPATAGNEGGTVVTVDGAGFAGATAVRVGNESAPNFTVESPTRIRVTTPRTGQIGPVDITVEGPGGTSALQGGNPASAFLLVGLPGAIPSLAAKALSETSVELNFAAAHNGDGSTPAQDYIIKQSPEKLTADTFDSATSTSLCGEKCQFDEPALSYTLRVDDLQPGQTYHYALRAVSDRGSGPISEDVAVTTPGTPPGAKQLICPDTPTPAANAVEYPGGRYSLVGLPTGTVLASDSPLYGWWDRGAGADYSVLHSSQPVAGGTGYWAWFACPTAIIPAAGDHRAVNVSLGAYHASIVGNPSATSPATVDGYDYAARWDPGAGGGSGAYLLSGYREQRQLSVGEAMWVFSYVRTEIRIEAAG